MLAGAAQSGILVTNSFVGSVDTTGQRAILNPIAAWLVITQPKAMLGRDDVLGACQLTEVRLRVMKREAKAVERSFSGRVAALIGWPNKVREGGRRGRRRGARERPSDVSTVTSAACQTVHCGRSRPQKVRRKSANYQRLPTAQSVIRAGQQPVSTIVNDYRSRGAQFYDI